MSNVFVLDTNKQPLNPVHPGLAWRLLSSGQAAVFRRYPFTIILKREVVNPQLEPLRLKIDPGSNTTGLAIVSDDTGKVVWAAELSHRGQTIKKALAARRALRRSRRARHTRYRKPRYANRVRPKGWLPPSIMSRIINILTWVKRLVRLSPITAISQELARFDTQRLGDASITGVEYQQGALAGYELREYLLEKWGRQCAYCNARNVPLQIDHILCRARGGTDRAGNLTLACQACNVKKGTQLAADFLKEKPDVLALILARTTVPLKDVAPVNATRWELYQRLRATGLPIECGTGGRTKYNRARLDLPKAHWIDAACVGASTPEHLCTTGIIPLLITANGHGSRQMCRMDEYGFPRTRPKQARRVKGYQTGDLVRAVVTTGNKVGTYVGRVAVRTTGSFNITTRQRTVQGISHRFCTPIHRSDGYSYQEGEQLEPHHPCPSERTPLPSACVNTGGGGKPEVR
jgi:5-methylcytosine-specific restriction endonuclease McrA